MTLPRALCMPVMAMARPRRPQSEADAVREAAQLVRQDMPDASIPAVAEEIAIRVVAELIEEIDITNDDPFATALDAIRQSLVKSPIRQLATCPYIDTMAVYRNLWGRKVSSIAGRILSLTEQAQMRTATKMEIRLKLHGRYLRCLREHR
ncbi:hypothetical protein [Sphingobium sp. BS19]|uniref:hypothetical protein n=1 Tax=Sphingobium sp. BS19 TaxID=3018973 RepID=UPI002493BC30|nr:hypothetical protein [Sphingobium sp. BS19]